MFIFFMEAELSVAASVFYFMRARLPFVTSYPFMVTNAGAKRWLDELCGSDHPFTEFPVFCFQVVFHCHHAKEPAKITQLTSLLDQKGQVISNKKPRCLLANQRAIIEV